MPECSGSRVSRPRSFPASRNAPSTNALLERPDAVPAMEAAYAEAGVTRFAAWVHENDEATRSALDRRGYRLDQTTRAMGMALEDVRLPRPQLDLGSVEWGGYLRIFGLSPGLLSRADRTAFRVLVARLDDENVATAMAFDHGSDTRDLQRRHAGARPEARPRHRPDRSPRARRARARPADGDPPGDRDGRGHVRRRRFSRSRADPRVRAVTRPGPPKGRPRACVQVKLV